MIRTALIAALAASALVACNKQDDHNLTANEPYDPQANVVANAGKVELPPAIAASKIYRCKDNSVVYVDWLADNQGAQFRSKQGETPVSLKPDENGALVADGGYKLIGLADAKTVTLAYPGHGSQACHL